ncbi:MAG: hypothetical protein MUE40_14655 [Anaerolineae bacterium]|jgi:hypothetical protein|nr:hypothetical protein [Anaerolineae bacterium]
MTAPADFEPIAPKEARARIQAAITARLGPDWQREESGWLLAHDSSYLVRLNRGSINLDIACDLLGEVTITEVEANPLQVSGRFIAWMVLGVSLFVAFLLAQIAGIFQPR